MNDNGDRITVIGTVATPPEFKRTTAGLTITSFRLARDLRRYDRSAGAWVDAGTNWYTVSVFRGLAEHVFESIHKGDRVLLTGALRVRDWETAERRGTAVDIDADAIGHDLLWGTTTFTKTPRGEQAAQAASWSPATAGDAWAAPGVSASAEGGPLPDTAAPAAEPEAAQLVGVGAGPAGTDDVPF